MPLYQTITVDEAEVKALVAQRWNVELGKCIKAAQNHTYLATEPSNGILDTSSLRKFIVRVTPDPDGSRLRPTQLEVDLLAYLHSKNLPVCSAIPQQGSNELILVANGNIIVVFHHAQGESIDYIAWKWMTEKDRVVGAGKWLARLHNLTRQYVKEKPEMLKLSRHWTELHDGVLKPVSVHPDDQKLESDPNSFGLIHGDLNAGNYFWLPQLGLPEVFDWDQLQRSWFMYDVSQPIFSVEMLAGAGNPFTGGDCPEANPKQFREWLIAGYEEESGTKIDREHLERMFLIRVELYRLFCSNGLKEGAPDAGLAAFFNFIMKWLNSKHPNSPKYD